MAYKDLGIEIGFSLTAINPETEEMQMCVVIDHWKSDEAMTIYDYDAMEWVEISDPDPVMGVAAEGPLVRFGSSDPVRLLLPEGGKSWIEHYQKVAETEKAICYSLDGSSYTTMWVPKSVIVGKTRPRSLTDKEAMQTPIKQNWAWQNAMSGGAIRP